MPGRIIQGMKQAGTKNPVFLLDELDKLGISFQGDPAAALLEVLDPAQNDSFTDHYVGVPFDLSEGAFHRDVELHAVDPARCSTAWSGKLAGYTEREKLEIARRISDHGNWRENGLTPEQISIPDPALSELITSYTREAGVRQLEREIGKLCRKVARQLADGDVERVVVEAPSVPDLIGRPKVHPERMAHEDQIGVATGMYYTPVGGDIMFVEASVMRGKGELVLTGQLGDVMKESARAALTYAKSHAEQLGIAQNVLHGTDVTFTCLRRYPKDGPSAGVTMATALVSALSKRPARHDVAMTGETTLRGRVLPIGGVKEKILGAVRAGLHEIILPKENAADLEDLPEDVRKSLTVHLVEELGEVFTLALRGARFEAGHLLFDDIEAPVEPRYGRQELAHRYSFEHEAKCRVLPALRKGALFVAERWGTRGGERFQSQVGDHEHESLRCGEMRIQVVSRLPEPLSLGEQRHEAADRGCEWPDVGASRLHTSSANSGLPAIKSTWASSVRAYRAMAVLKDGDRGEGLSSSRVAWATAA